MLTRLTVSNLAVVEAAEADFAPGLNVLTGETGAGKSVLMGALELVLGGRADSDAVRDGAKEARVEAEFALEGERSARVAALLGELGIGFEDGALVVRRAVSSAGGGRAWVNDSAASVATLRRLGALLVDIHGPRANQNILDAGFQRTALDGFGAIRDSSAMRNYARAWTELSDCRAEAERLAGAGVSADEAEFLRYQVNELEEADVTEADDDLAERQAAAAHAGELVESANAITEALGGDEGASEILVRLQPTFAALARHLPQAAEWSAEAERLTREMQELSRTVAEAASAVDLEPGELDELDARLAVVNRMRRKYGEDVAGALAAKRARLEEIERRDEKLAENARRTAAAEAAVKAAGSELTKKRRVAAQKLAKAVTAELHNLGFLRAKFGVTVSAAAPEASGCDRVTYELEPNPGEPARPLAEIASSGEIARVMLALKGVLAAHDATDVLVFDEIDANIGGETGHAVGERLRRVARDHQVIAITHLPQSAVWGDRHLVVTKSVSGGRTRARITEVTGAARAKEIARMLGGEGSTSVALRHAEELLERVK